MIAVLALPGSWQIWLTAGTLFLLLIFVLAFLLSYALRRSLRPPTKESAEELTAMKPRSDNPAAFMTASMQAVIQRLREQEKELEALHRREKERAQQTERLSEAVTRNMPAGLLLINATVLITSANPAAEAALGIRGLAYRRYTEVLGRDSALARLLTICLEHAFTFRREEVEYITPASEVRQLGVTISPILHGPRKVSGALCLLSDLTELTLLQKQMRLKENLATLGELSAGIAHEFKNALATISGYAQMIRSETSEGDLRENAQRILEETRALTHVVTEFLKFARPLELAYEPVAMQPLIERVVAEVLEVVPQVSISTEGDFAEVSGDEGLLRQAFLNLARNAAEAAAGAPSGGRVVLRGTVERSTGRGVQRVSIADNGPGIPADALAKIFLPFYTTKSNGTGLGLAIVQKIVVQHGGAIEARNEAGSGAEFILWLPLNRDASEAVDSASGRI
jgi:nitrogen-specific signal transduction histidine kinase